MDLNINSIKNNDNVVIHTPTKEEAEEVCRIFHEADITWSSGVSVLNVTKWDNHGERQTYWLGGPYLSYSNIDFVKEYHPTKIIILAKDFIAANAKRPEPKFKKGDKVNCIAGFDDSEYSNVESNDNWLKSNNWSDTTIKTVKWSKVKKRWCYQLMMSYGHLHANWIAEHALVLKEEPVSKEVPFKDRFKRYDKVKITDGKVGIIASTCNRHDQFLMEVVAGEVGNPRSSYGKSYDTDGYIPHREDPTYWSICSSFKPELIGTVTPPVREEEYKIGDWVYIIHNGFSTGINEIGDIKQIESIEYSPDLHISFKVKFTDGNRGFAFTSQGTVSKYFRRATKSEIDSVTKKTPVFKEGDYLTVINGSGNNAKEGSIAKITSKGISDSDNYVDVIWKKVVNPKGDCIQEDGEYRINSFRLSTPEEIASLETKSVQVEECEFKVGDYVTVTGLKVQSGSGNHSNHKIDDTFQIKEIEKSSISDIKYWLRDKIGGDSIAATLVRKATQAEIDKHLGKSTVTQSTISQCPFKKGDIVRDKRYDGQYTVELVPGMPEYDSKGYAAASEGFVTWGGTWYYWENFELVESVTSNPQPEPIVPTTDSGTKLCVNEDSANRLNYWQSQIGKRVKIISDSTYQGKYLNALGTIKSITSEHVVQIQIDKGPLLSFFTEDWYYGAEFVLIDTPSIIQNSDNQTYITAPSAKPTDKSIQVLPEIESILIKSENKNTKILIY